MAALTNIGSRVWNVFVLANKVLAVLYVGLAFVVVFSVAQRGASPSGGLVLILLILALAFGHFTRKEWAIKTSATVFAVVVLLAIPYLFSTYEHELVPSLHMRIVQFVLIAILALAMLANYLLYKRLEKKSHLDN